MREWTARSDRREWGEPPKLAGQPGGPELLPVTVGRSGGWCRPRGAGRVWGTGSEPMGLVVVPAPFRAGPPASRSRSHRFWLAAHPGRAATTVWFRGPRSGGRSGRVGLLGMMGWRVPAIKQFWASPCGSRRSSGWTSRRSRALAEGHPIYETSMTLVPHLRDPGDHWHRSRHGARPDDPAASVSGTGTGLTGCSFCWPPWPPFCLRRDNRAVGGRSYRSASYWSLWRPCIERDASSRPPGCRGSLSVRLLLSPGSRPSRRALACLWLGVVVAHDFERARAIDPGR